MTKTRNDPPPQICILLALYQGQAYLRAQLDSYVAQTHQNWVLLVSDDGSTDQSAVILAKFQVDHPDKSITLRQGSEQGFARNFLSLMQAVPPDIPYAALSDQDDVWFPDKLSRAVEQFQAVPLGCPALYCARTIISAEDLTPIAPSPVFRREPAFGNALVQSIGGGNTMVLNRAALDLVAAVAAQTPAPVAHDWWLYQLITGCGGQVIRDPEPVLFYRQHRHNLIGANLSAVARLQRIKALLNGRFRSWNKQGLEALHPAVTLFTPAARDCYNRFVAARQGAVVGRLRALRASGVYRQSSLGTVALYLACLLNRL